MKRVPLQKPLHCFNAKGNVHHIVGLNGLAWHIHRKPNEASAHQGLLMALAGHR